MILQLIAAAVLTVVITIAIATAILLANEKAVQLLFSGSNERQEKIAFGVINVGGGIFIAIFTMSIVQIVIALI